MTTIREYIEKMANSVSTVGSDDSQFQGILRHIGFPRAIVTCGIVYFEGNGTIDAPPAAISQVASMILKALK